MDEDAKRKHNKPEKGGQPGVYKHPLVKEELHATSFPQADALIRQGWVYDRELPKHEEVQEAGVDTSTDVNANAVAQVKDLQAQLDAANAALKSARAQVRANKKSEEAANKAEANATLDRQESQKEQDAARSKSDEKIEEANKELGKDNK